MSDLVQLSFDYSLVSEEQAHQLQAIYNRVLIRHMSTAYEDGKDMLEAKNIKGLSYKNFIDWAQTMFGWSEMAINQKINVALNFGPTTPGVVIADKAIYLLSTKRVPESAREEAKDRAASGEKITEEIAKQIRDAHKAKEEAENAAKIAQQQLFEQKNEAKTTADQLSAHIRSLQEEIAKLTAPQIVEKHVTPPDVLEKLKHLEDQISTLTRQKENLAKLNEELSADLDAVEEQREQEQHDSEIRQAWRQASDAAYKSAIKFMGQIPMPIDTAVFEAKDWARVDQVVAALQEAIRKCQSLRETPMLMIVDAR